MQAICIDGKPKVANFRLPEFVLLDVEQSPVFSDSYRVIGYDYDDILNVYVYWKKRRFLPVSKIDETELIKERQELITI